jgi:uncharacterized membrane protein
MSDPVQYMVKDAAGNIYGPASIEMLRQWIGQRRVIGTMSIAPQGTEDWQLVSTHAELAEALKAPAPLAAPTPAAADLSTTSGAATPQAVTPNYATPMGYAGSNPLALWSMICGIGSLVLNGLGILLSLFFCCFWVLGVPVAMAAVIMGYFTLRKIRENPTMPGRGMAKAGLITGLCSLLIIAILFIGGLLKFGISVFGPGRSWSLW